MADRPLCLICSILLEDTGKRRNLTTESSSKVAQLVKKLLGRVHPENSIAMFMQKSQFVCRKCFASFNKVLELSQKLKELEDNLQATVKSSFEQFISTQPDHVSSPSSSHMRLHDEETMHSRHCRVAPPNTPTRQFLTQPVVGNTPVIAVCLYHYACIPLTCLIFIGS